MKETGARPEVPGGAGPRASEHPDEVVAQQLHAAAHRYDRLLDQAARGRSRHAPRASARAPPPRPLIASSRASAVSSMRFLVKTDADAARRVRLRPVSRPMFLSSAEPTAIHFSCLRPASSCSASRCRRASSRASAAAPRAVAAARGAAAAAANASRVSPGRDSSPLTGRGTRVSVELVGQRARAAPARAPCARAAAEPGGRVASSAGRRGASGDGLLVDRRSARLERVGAASPRRAARPHAAIASSVPL